MKKPVFLAGTFVAAGLVFYITSIHRPGPVEVHDDFEDGPDPAWKWEIALDRQAQIVDDPSGAENKVIYFNIRRDDPIVKKSKRVEVKLGTVGIGSAYRYRFSAYLPEDYAVESQSENLAQWHGMPDFALLEYWRSPPLKIMTQNGRWILSQKVSDLKVNRTLWADQDTVTHTVTDLGPAEPGVWVDWDFQILWSLGDDGRIRISRDGKEIFRHRGLNTYNDWKGPYFKIGMYKPGWTVDPQGSKLDVRDVYYDDIIVEKMEPAAFD